MHAAHQESGSVESVARLGDDELVAALHRMLRQERTLSAALLVHLAEVDARGLYRQHAYSSMFDYCVQALLLSEAEAYLRIRAARLGRQFPRVLQMLAQGELHLSAVKLLAPVLTADVVDRDVDLDGDVDVGATLDVSRTDHRRTARSAWTAELSTSGGHVHVALKVHDQVHVCVHGAAAVQFSSARSGGTRSRATRDTRAAAR